MIKKEKIQIMKKKKKKKKEEEEEEETCGSKNISFNAQGNAECFSRPIVCGKDSHIKVMGIFGESSIFLWLKFISSAWVSLRQRASRRHWCEMSSPLTFTQTKPFSIKGTLSSTKVKVPAGFFPFFLFLFLFFFFTVCLFVCLFCSKRSKNYD